MKRDTKTHGRPWVALTLALALGPLAAGCGSSPTSDDKARSESPPPPRDTGAGSGTAPANKGPSGDQLPAITIKRGDRHMPEAAYLDKPDKGNVSFDFKNADLARIVLPLFSKQSDVPVDYGGPPKKLDLRLVNVPWRDALGMICQFTQTHVVQSEELHGHLELKLGYADSKSLLDRFDPAHPEKAPVPAAGSKATDDGSAGSAGASAGTTAGASDGTSSPPAQDPIEDPDAKGKQQIERLRTGVGTTSSGGR